MNKPTFLRRASSRAQSGFSLVEVTLAIGIVAFAFMALFGLLPTGLNVFRSAIDASTSSQIVDQVVQSAQQTDFDRLVNPSTPNTDTYYDEQANLLTDTTKGDGSPSTDSHDPRMIYMVRVTATAPTAVPIDSSGGSSGSNQIDPNNTNIATLKVLIAKDPGGHDQNPFRDSNKANFGTYTAYVARNRSAFETRDTQ